MEKYDGVDVDISFNFKSYFLLLNICLIKSVVISR